MPLIKACTTLEEDYLLSWEGGAVAKTGLVNILVKRERERERERQHCLLVISTVTKGYVIP
jgi:hypothetical protein